MNVHNNSPAKSPETKTEPSVICLEIGGATEPIQIEPHSLNIDPVTGAIRWFYRWFYRANN
eukprot:scaffold107_cov269-Chaetoceros_neogracile.AAC.57